MSNPYANPIKVDPETAEQLPIDGIRLALFQAKEAGQIEDWKYNPDGNGYFYIDMNGTGFERYTPDHAATSVLTSL